MENEPPTFKGRGVHHIEPGIYLPEVEGRHSIRFQESASDIHLGRLELCNPSSNIGQVHPCS